MEQSDRVKPFSRVVSVAAYIRILTTCNANGDFNASLPPAFFTSFSVRFFKSTERLKQMSSSPLETVTVLSQRMSLRDSY